MYVTVVRLRPAMIYGAKTSNDVWGRNTGTEENNSDVAETIMLRWTLIYTYSHTHKIICMYIISCVHPPSIYIHIFIYTSSGTMKHKYTRSIRSHIWRQPLWKTTGIIQQICNNPTRKRFIYTSYNTQTAEWHRIRSHRYNDMDTPTTTRDITIDIWREQENDSHHSLTLLPIHIYTLKLFKIIPPYHCDRSIKRSAFYVQSSNLTA